MPRTTAAFLTAFVFVPLCAPAAAQTFRVLPDHADFAEGHQNVDFPFGAPAFRSQILVDAAHLAANGASLTGISFRADRLLAPAGARLVPNVTVTLSHTGTALGAMSPVFANNVGGTGTVVFQGTVTLPAQGIGAHGPLPWNIDVPFAQPFAFTTAQGNLLVDIVGNNATGGTPFHILDAVQGGGASTQYGVSGFNPFFDTLLLLVTTGNSIEPRLISPGNTIHFLSTLFFTQPPGFVAIGFVPQFVPIDLAPIGAPGNFLYIDPIVFAPHTWLPGLLGWQSTLSITLPNTPALVGVHLYGQSTIFVPIANPLGLVTSHAAEVRIGDQFEVVPMQQVNAPDPNAAIGTLVDFTSGTQPEYGAAAIRFAGTFF